MVLLIVLPGWDQLGLRKVLDAIFSLKVELLGSSIELLLQVTLILKQLKFVACHHTSRFGGVCREGPEPSNTKCAWRVAAQLGIIQIGRDAACVG